jgi:hypothetical protein
MQKKPGLMRNRPKPFSHRHSWPFLMSLMRPFPPPSSGEVAPSYGDGGGEPHKKIPSSRGSLDNRRPACLKPHSSRDSRDSRAGAGTAVTGNSTPSSCRATVVQSDVDTEPRLRRRKDRERFSRKSGFLNPIQKPSTCRPATRGNFLSCTCRPPSADARDGRSSRSRSWPRVANSNCIFGTKADMRATIGASPSIPYYGRY